MLIRDDCVPLSPAHDLVLVRNDTISARKRVDRDRVMSVIIILFVFSFSKNVRDGRSHVMVKIKCCGVDK